MYYQKYTYERLIIFYRIFKLVSIEKDMFTNLIA